MLTVLSVAYPLAPVSPDAVGGAEQILAALDTALVAAGHRSIVIACDGSVVAGELVALPAPDGPTTHASWCAAHEACRAAIRDVLARERVDLVHMHGIDFHAYLPPAGVPVLATLHLPIAWYPPEALRPERPRTYLQCVSRTQHASAPPEAPLLEPIENGVELDRLRAVGPRGEAAVTLGRICPEKGQHVALEAATHAGVPLVIAGRVFWFPEHVAYFRELVEPRLVAPHRFIGSVAGEAKVRLVAQARCVVVPSLVAETSSLVAMEALACGTPVVGFRRGALVELVEDGVTGWLANDLEQLARAIRDAPALSRARCRAVAEERCSRRRMCERYLARYEALCAGAPTGARATPPRLRTELVDRAGLATIAPAWLELWARSSEATIFQRPEWCLPWCRHLWHGDVEAIAVWRGHVLAGLLPLFRWCDGDADVLSLLGAGVSDYQGALVAGDADEVLRAFEHTLAQLPWDRIELSELPSGSVLARLALPGRDERHAQEPCPALAVVESDPLAAVPADTRREIAYQRRRITREVGLEHVVVRADAVVAKLAQLHTARWQARGQPGMLDIARQQFLADAVAQLSARDLVLGAGIQLGGELAGIAVGFVDREALRYYLGGFAPRHERRSPGTLAIAAAIEESGRRGLRVFDFLRGAERYKYRFGATERLRLERRVVHRA